jgi:peptidoglycan/LPS O-acetylase OafA/YrhL
MTLIPALTPLGGVAAAVTRRTHRLPLESTGNEGGTFTGARHLPALDGVRGVAVLLVLVTHFFAPLAWAVSRQKAEAGKLWIASHLFDAGWVGVDLFFVLSGFLITGILADAKGKPNYFRNFFARRSLRVFPLYYGVLVAACVVLPLAGFASVESGKQAWLWTYGVSLFPAFNAGAEFTLATGTGLNFTHFWSLAVEEHFYLAWPVVVLLASRQVLMRACVVMCVASLVARCGAVNLGASTPMLYEFTFFRMDGLLAGAWVALAIRGTNGIQPLVRGAWVALLASGVALMMIGVLAHGMIRANPLVQTVGFSALAVFFAAGVLLVVARQQTMLVRTVLRAAPLRSIGKYSYGIYVYHGLLLPVFDRTLFPVSAELPVTSPAFFASLAWHVVGSTVVTVLLAVGSYHLFEAQFLKLKRYFPSSSSSVSAKPLAAVRLIPAPV